MPYVEPGYAEDQGRYFGGPGSLVRFTAADGQTLNFDQAPLRPPGELNLIQAESRTAAGVPFGHAVYGADETLRLRWPRLYTYHRDRLLDWFRSVVVGMGGVFTYRDVAGVDRAVRSASPALPEIREIAPDRHQTEIDLVIET